MFLGLGNLRIEDGPRTAEQMPCIDCRDYALLIYWSAFVSSVDAKAELLFGVDDSTVIRGDTL